MESSSIIIRSKSIIKKLDAIGVINIITNKDFKYDNLSEWGTWYRESHDVIERIGIKASWGLTKVCFFSSELENYVIKINFASYRKDYCEREYINFLKAIDENLDNYFPETIKVSFHNINYYIQEKAEVDEENNKSIISSYMKSEYCIGNCKECCYCWCDSGITPSSKYCEISDEENQDYNIIYAMTGNERLYNFCNKNGINDLHSGNWGFKNGRPLIIDFSGYGG